MITFKAGNSAFLIEILGLERTQMRICLVGVTVSDSILKLLCEHTWATPDWAGLIDLYNFSLGKRLKDHLAHFLWGHLAFAWALPQFS